MNFEDTRFIETHSLNQSDIMSDIIEQKMLKILLNNTKLRQFLLNNQLNSNKEIEEISIMGIMILLYTLAMVVTYYSILLYNNIPNSNSPKPKRRKTIKKSTKDSIESIIQSFKDNKSEILKNNKSAYLQITISKTDCNPLADTDTHCGQSFFYIFISCICICISICIYH